MICADTNCWAAFWAGRSGPDVALLEQALQDRSMGMLPVVLAEVLSETKLPGWIELGLRELPLLEPTPGYWYRAGKLRASLFRLGYRPKLADTLIAQSCLDYQAPLLTRDRDFSAFAKHCGLRLL